MSQDPEKILILSGVGGAGTSTALQAFEDLGYFTVDNVPPALWLDLAREAATAGEKRIVITVDSRTERFLGGVEDGLARLTEAGLSVRVIFLTASDAVLIRRYGLTRRAHPLSEGTLQSDLERERHVLGFLRSRADIVLDTSELTSAQLRDTIARQFGTSYGDAFRLQLLSFGFKNGAPLDADTVLDVRSMPNPYYDEELRKFGGTDPRVKGYVYSGGGREMYERLSRFVREAARLANASGRRTYTVAIGCTGGQHRSVAVVERLASELADEFIVTPEHRDLAAALQEYSG